MKSELAALTNRLNYLHADYTAIQNIMKNWEVYAHCLRQDVEPTLARMIRHPNTPVYWAEYEEWRYLHPDTLRYGSTSKNPRDYSCFISDRAPKKGQSMFANYSTTYTVFNPAKPRDYGHGK